MYGNNAPVGNGRPAGEVDFLQYRDTEDDSTEPVYPILVEIITMLDRSEVLLDSEEIDTIKSCVKKHVHVQTSRITTRYTCITMLIILWYTISYTGTCLLLKQMMEILLKRILISIQIYVTLSTSLSSGSIRP